MKDKKVGEISITRDGELILSFNDDIANKIYDKEMQGDAIDLANEVLDFLEKVLGGDIDED